MIEEPVIIPYNQLQPSTLEKVLEEFASRDGTDYGSSEARLADKVAELRNQLITGKIVISFDPSTNSCNLLDRTQL